MALISLISLISPSFMNSSETGIDGLQQFSGQALDARLPLSQAYGIQRLDGVSNLPDSL